MTRMNVRSILGVIASGIMAFSAGDVLAYEGAQSLERSNFSYSNAGFQIGKATPDEEIVFGNEVYEDFGLFSFAGSYQVANNMAIGAGIGAIANEGARTELSTSSYSILATFPVPLGARVDLVPAIGLTGYEDEACVDGSCVQFDDNGIAYGMGLRAWAVPGKLELNLAYEDTNMEDIESTVTAGIAGWLAQHHRIGLNYTSSEFVSSVALGYNYTW